jgi:hypothetical protein
MVKMKKVLVLLTMMVAVLCFSTSAFAVYGDPICSNCKAGPIGKISCSLVDQGENTCYAFDYETRAGYCSATTVNELLSTYRAIFSICNCKDAGTNFVEDARIGVRMTILVNGLAGERGAYWSNGASAAVRFGKYATLKDACADTTVGMVNTFGAGKFYKSDLTTEVTTLTADTTCVVPAANQATVIVTNPTAGYVITAADVLNKLSRWWIDIAPIRIDKNVLHNGETISVKIETLNMNTGGICADCVSTCECIIDVAVVCCSTATSSCLFPYFTSTTAATAEQPYWNGIAIVNTSATAGTATLTVKQKDGKSGSFTTPAIPAYSMYVAALENVAFVGTGLGGLPVYIKVVGTFTGLDGFAMIANTATGESMGYLCRMAN